VEDVKKTFLFAMENGVKGVTVFRDGCKEGVLVNKDKKEEVVPVSMTPTEDNSDRDTRIRPKKRGNRTIGATTRIKMLNHNLYVTINRNNEGEIVEIFATVGESKTANAHHTSGVEDSWSEGLAKIISLALRAGVAPDAIIHNLKNIPSDKPVLQRLEIVNRQSLFPLLLMP
jgi:ribonucleoside-diphosphate reductase alpha chain